MQESSIHPMDLVEQVCGEGLAAFSGNPPKRDLGRDTCPTCGRVKTIYLWGSEAITCHGCSLIVGKQPRLDPTKQPSRIGGMTADMALVTADGADIWSTIRTSRPTTRVRIHHGGGGQAEVLRRLMAGVEQPFVCITFGKQYAKVFETMRLNLSGDYAALSGYGLRLSGRNVMAINVARVRDLRTRFATVTPREWTELADLLALRRDWQRGIKATARVGKQRVTNRDEYGTAMAAIEQKHPALVAESASLPTRESDDFAVLVHLAGQKSE